jgi:biotin carboxylase
MGRIAAPWVLKPRSMAGSIGIMKIHNQEEFWRAIEALGDMQSQYLLEQFVPGDIFHVDSVIFDGQIRFAIASGYGRPPMEVSHEGGVFTTRILDRDSSLAHDLSAANAEVQRAFGMARGVSHTEFIRAAADGRIYFLETSARVGGAHVSDLVEAATGLNLWEEWAKVECSETTYPSPQQRLDYAGLLVTLARQEHPDTSEFNDPEVVWRLSKDHHAGLIVRSSSVARVEQLMADYSDRMLRDIQAYAPPRDRPTS